VSLDNNTKIVKRYSETYFNLVKNLVGTTQSIVHHQVIQILPSTIYESKSRAQMASVLHPLVPITLQHLLLFLFSSFHERMEAVEAASSLHGVFPQNMLPYKQD
jgi:hypothetical protein